jgi:hypothetical protein
MQKFRDLCGMMPNIAMVIRHQAGYLSQAGFTRFPTFRPRVRRAAEPAD